MDRGGPPHVGTIREDPHESVYITILANTSITEPSSIRILASQGLGQAITKRAWKTRVQAVGSAQGESNMGYPGDAMDEDSKSVIFRHLDFVSDYMNYVRYAYM